jgi:transcriptional regulator with XRE-family HTH domain
VAEILHRERTAQNLSLTRLAESAALSRQAVSYIEQGRRIPSLETLLRITRVLKLDLADVIRQTDRKR